VSVISEEGLQKKIKIINLELIWNTKHLNLLYCHFDFILFHRYEQPTENRVLRKQL
jgi:hypothetical protein